jgi:hypothetical protein
VNDGNLVREARNPALLKVPFNAQPGLSSTRTQVDEQRAGEYAFVAWRTGHEGQQAARTRLFARSTGLGVVAQLRME